MILNVGKRTTIYLTNEWKQIFQIRKCNWYSITPFHLYFEVDSMCNMLEWTWTVWGFGITIRYDRDFLHSEAHRIAEEAWKGIQRKEDGK